MRHAPGALAKAKDLETTRVYLLVETTDLMTEPVKLQTGAFETAGGSKIHALFTGAAASAIPPSGACCRIRSTSIDSNSRTWRGWRSPR